MGGMQADEKPAQWMARFRHTGVNGTEKTLSVGHLFVIFRLHCLLHTVAANERSTK